MLFFQDERSQVLTTTGLVIAVSDVIFIYLFLLIKMNHISLKIDKRLFMILNHPSAASG